MRRSRRVGLRGLATLAACVFFGLPAPSPAHETGDGGAHHGLQVFRQSPGFKLIHFPKALPTPDVTLPDLNGKPVRLLDLKGKVLLLNFWATWCPPCVEEMPSMEKLHRRFRGRPLAVVAVSMDEGGVEPVREFVKKWKLTFLVLRDAEKKTESPFGVRGLPLSYVIDRRGRMIAGAIGAQNWASQEAFEYFERLVKKAEAR